MLISFCGGITAKEFGNHVGGSNSTNFTFCSWLIQQHDWKNIKPQSSYAQTDILLHLFRQVLQSAHTSRHFTVFLCLAFKLTQQRRKLRQLNRWPWINKTICGWMETQHTYSTWNACHRAANRLHSFTHHMAHKTTLQWINSPVWRQSISIVHSWSHSSALFHYNQSIYLLFPSITKFT